MDRFRFGRVIRALRQRRGWRQVDLAARVGCSGSAVSRLESGEIARVSWADLVAVAEGLGARLELDLRWHGEGIDRLLDERHAAAVEMVVRLLRQCGWDTSVEVSFSIFGERGSIDVVGRHGPTGLLVVIEVKASIGDVNQTVIGLDRKARLAPEIARERGWACRGVGRFLVIADGSTSRDRVARHAVTFDAAFPLRGRACAAWLRRPAAPAPSGLFFLSAFRDSRTTGIARRRVRSGRPRGARSRSTTARDRP